ncbi:MAG: hypothetical protein HFI46_11265 [Lachnospiraceae bacterium]|nr:hypothetical protein [Lachnospiraceae bacterium]
MRREWWKEDLICLLKGEEAWEEPALAADEKEAHSKERCPYCGKRTADYLDEHFLKGKMCDACYRTEIRSQVQAADLVEQCFRNLYAMYGISKWSDLHVGFLRPENIKAHQFPWDDRDIKYENKKWYLEKDRLLIVSKLPRNTAETAVVKKLLEQYMKLRVPDSHAKEDGENKKYAGLILWCVLHYLFLVQGKECAERCEEALFGEEAKNYKQCQTLLGTPMDGIHREIDELIRLFDSPLGNAD